MRETILIASLDTALPAGNAGNPESCHAQKKYASDMRVTLLTPGKPGEDAVTKNTIQMILKSHKQTTHSLESHPSYTTPNMHCGQFGS